MELKLRVNNTIICDNEELNMIRKAMDHYTDYILYKNSNMTDLNHPDMIESMKYEKLCQSLGIEGYEFS